MKRRLEALNAAQHKAAEAMYRTASASGGGAPGGDPVVRRPDRRGGRDAGDVIDAEVVEEEEVTTGLKAQGSRLKAQGFRLWALLGLRVSARALCSRAKSHRF